VKGGESMITMRKAIHLLDIDRKFVSGRLNQSRNPNYCSCAC